MAVISLLAAAQAGAQLAPALPEILDIEQALLETPDGAELAAALDAYRTNLGSDDTQALEAAKQVVALGVELWGDQDPRIAKALTNLAIAQYNAGNHSTARDNFLSAIRVSEVTTNSIVTPTLINPLRGLATSLVALDNTEAAITIFERAIHVLHVNEGPNSLDQLPVLEALSRAYFFDGDTREANKIQDNIFWLQKRQFAEDSDQYTDAMLRRARWYVRTRNFYEATQLYRRAERVLTENHGPNDIRLIQPLLEMGFVAPRQTDGNTSLNYATVVQEGRRAIARAVAIARENGEAHPEVLVRTLARQGDWLASVRLSRSARLPYREAWELANSDPDLHELRDTLFSEPVSVVEVDLEMDRVFGYRATKAGMTERAHRDRGFVELVYNVSSLGKPFDIRLVDSAPPGLMDVHVIRTLRRFVFRPAFVDGKPVEVRDLEFRHEFRYDASNLSDRNKAFVERMQSEREAALAEATTDNAAQAGSTTDTTDLAGENQP